MASFRLFDRYVVSVVGASGGTSDVREALDLELDVVGALWGDRSAVARVIADTLEASVLLLVRPLQRDGDRQPLLGAARLVSATAACRPAIPTLVDMATDSGAPLAAICSMVEAELGTDRTLICDATSLAPQPGPVADMAASAALVLHACRCVGASLLASGRATHVVGHFHDVFLGFCRRQGYALTPLGASSGRAPFAQPRPRGAFVAVAGSLAAYDEQVRGAPDGSLLARLRPTYLACSTVDLFDGLVPVSKRVPTSPALAAVGPTTAD